VDIKVDTLYLVKSKNTKPKRNWDYHRKKELSCNTYSRKSIQQIWGST